jgi:hypothetical protein
MEGYRDMGVRNSQAFRVKIALAPNRNPAVESATYPMAKAAKCSLEFIRQS